MLQNIDNFFFNFLFRRSGLTSCVRSNTTSKRIELESPTTSQIKDNFKGIPTIIYLLMFHNTFGKRCCKTLVLFFIFLFRRSGLTSCVRSNTISKRIELESPITSQIKDNFKGFPTVICSLMFQYS